MESYKKTLSLFIVLPLLLLCRSDECPSLPDNLTCYSDYNKSITCLWNSTYVTDHTDAACTIHAKYGGRYKRYSASCHLEPVDISTPALKTCSLIFLNSYTFSSFHVLSFNLSCNHMKPVTTRYQPACHIRVNPPGKPEVNVTTVSWLSQVTRHKMIDLYKTELQWKQQDQSWSDPAVQKNSRIQCERECTAEMEPNLLILDERYEARVRVRSVFDSREGAWSDWSPTASWVSSVGKRKPLSGAPTSIVYIVVGSIVVLLAIGLYSTNRTWVDVVKTVAVPPIPDPSKSFLQDVNFKRVFTSESFHSFLKPVEMITVELTSSVDAVTACRPDEKIVINKGSYDSTSSSFSNPSYSELCTPPPISSLRAGNLKPCAADTPYGPVGPQGEGKSKEQESNEAREKENEMVKLLLKGSSNSEPVQVISDYERSEKLNIDRSRLQSLDSGVSSCEEVSEESMEVDSMNLNDSHDEDPEDEDEKEEENEQKAVFQKLLGGKFERFIQVCSDYERVEKPPADSPELPSLDSGVSSGGEEQMSQDESMEDVEKSTESTHFLFPPHPPSALSCSLLSFPQTPLNSCGPGFSPALQLQPSPVLQGFAGRSLEPSGDGYMPVKQEG